MLDINRRNILGAAGATIALAACSKKSETGASSATAKSRYCIDIPTNKGGAAIFGTFPDNKLPNSGTVGKQKPVNYKGSGFKPNHDFLTYLKFEGGKLKIRTAFFKIEPAGAPENLALIAERFAEIGKGAWPADAIAPAENFDGFGFGGQTRLYFFVDNGDDVKFDEINLIQMTWYKAKDRSKKKLDEDNSFWNIQIRDSILSAENWYATEKGAEIKEAYSGSLPPTEQVEFSMNIHLDMNCAGAGVANYIPIIIDPDGTNGIKKP